MLNLIKNLIGLNSALAKRVEAERLYAEAEAFLGAKEFKKAFPLMKSCAEMGDSNATVHVALMLLKGQGVDPDWNAASGYFELALARGEGNIHVMLGTMHGMGGYGLKRNREKAEYHLTQGISVEKDASGEQMLAMLRKKEGVFGGKETPRPRIPWK